MDKLAYYQTSDVSSVYDRTRFTSAAGAWTHAVESRLIRESFPKEAVLLELACGTGRLMKSMIAEGYQVTGVDQSPAMLSAGGLTAPQAVIGNVLKLPFPDSAFDGAYTFRFTNHCTDLTPVFRETFRVLKRGGGFLFDAMRWSPLLWDSKAFGGRNYMVTPSEVKHLLEKTGFVVEQARPLFPIGPYLLSRVPYAVARGLSLLWPRKLFAINAFYARKLP